MKIGFLWSIQSRKVHGRLNASWKISSLAVNGQSFLVIDGYLLNLNAVWLDEDSVGHIPDLLISVPKEINTAVG